MVVALPHYRLISMVATPAMLGAVFLLVFLVIPGVPASIVSPVKGTRGWINLGPVDFQPSEVAKIATSSASRVCPLSQRPVARSAA